MGANMNGSPAAIRGISSTILQASGWIVLLAAILAGAMPGAALALPGVQTIAGLGRALHSEAGLPMIRASGCADDGAACPDDGPPPIRGRVSRWEPVPERHAVPYEPPAYEEPCLEDRRPARTYVYHAPPPPRDYPVYEGDWCGIRCWYRRLRAGYCGRGCDYYRFRLTEFPQGKLGVYRDRRYACRTTR
jgi:hypothetical protein